ncbi:MAG TPA: LamG domain-containing protein [Polyangiaceae bacterium]|nr:LamG domain-containing protein [Polyangiaceae bacterium]
MLRQALLAATVALTALAGCTQSRADAGPTHLDRQLEDSGQNFALSFDGVDDYATSATAQFPDGRHDQTLSAWFLVDTLVERAALLTLRKDFESGIELGLRQGLVGAWRVYGDRQQVLAKTAITTGTWHHAAYVFDGTTNLLYVDGSLVASSTDAPDKRTPTSCYLGTLDGTRDLFKGRLDAVHVFEAVRSAEQLAGEFAGKFSKNEPGLVLDLTFDESAGSVVFDHSEQQNDGQLGDGVPLRMPNRTLANLPQSDH